MEDLEENSRSLDLNSLNEEIRRGLRCSELELMLSTSVITFNLNDLRLRSLNADLNPNPIKCGSEPKPDASN